jgi:hypothetical protein
MPAAASATTNGSSSSGAANGQQQRQRQRQPSGPTARSAPSGADAPAAITVPAAANEPIEVRRYNAGPLDVHVNAPSSLAHSHNSGWGSWLLSGGWRGGNNSGRRNERGVNGATAATTTSASGSGSKAPSALPDVPRSLLYDPLAPMSVSAEVELAGKADKGLAVAVSVSGQSKDAAGTAVVAPQVGCGAAL